MKRILLLASAAMLFASCWLIERPAGDKNPLPGTYLLPIIETTDIHGYIVNDDNGTIHYRMAYVADKVKDIRGHGDEYDKSRLLLLDGGDLYQGASVSNFLSGKPVYASIDMMEYDAVALGNHEFDWGFESMVDPDATLLDYEWNGVRCVNEVPVVCANLYRNGTRDPSTKDYVIVEKTATGPQGATVKVRIGIVGFAIDYSGSIMTSQFTGKGYSIDENYSIANGIAEELESTGQCDATILLIHGAADSAAKQLMPGSPFDLVLGGHSHIMLSGWTNWGLPYLQGGRYCEHYAHADLKFTVSEEGAVSYAGVVNLTNYNVDASLDLHTYDGQNASDLAEDILSVSEDAVSVTSRQLGDVIGYIDTGATTGYISGSGERATIMSNWMCDIIRRIGDADVSFVNSGGVRTSIPLGTQSRRDITVANVFEIFPFNNTTYVYCITYAELLHLFEYSVTSGGAGLFTYVTGVDCYFTQQRKIHSLRKDGAVIYQNGKWTGDWASRTLVLAVSEYLATSERTDYYTGMKNPLLEWNKTSRLLGDSLVDNENAVRVLREESASSGGRLHIDKSPHFILY